MSEVSANEQHVFEFSLNEGYELSYGWFRQAGARMSSEYPSKRDVYQIVMPRLQPGNYFLRLYVRQTGERTYWSCGEFGFIVK